MIIEVPDWCTIGKYIQWKDIYGFAGSIGDWHSDKILSYGVDGFFHQAAYCPVYYHKFSDYGETIREIDSGK